MSSDNIKEHTKEEREMTTSDSEIFKGIKSSPCPIAYSGAVAAVVILGIAALFYLKNQTKKQVAMQEEKDRQTDMILIGMEKSVTEKGYAGLMFFSKSGQTNQTDAMMHYATIDPNVIEKVRHLKLGEKKKIAEWKGLVEQKYIKGYSWHELNREKGN